MIPIAKQDNVLVALIKYQGKKQMFKVWGIDTTTSNRVWSYITEVTSVNDLLLPYDLSNSNHVVVEATEGGIMIIEKQEGDSGYTLHIHLLDTTTGDLLHETERSFEYISLNGKPASIGNNVYFATDISLYRFDTTTGKLDRALGQKIR